MKKVENKTQIVEKRDMKASPPPARPRMRVLCLGPAAALLGGIATALALIPVYSLIALAMAWADSWISVGDTVFLGLAPTSVLTIIWVLTCLYLPLSLLFALLNGKAQNKLAREGFAAYWLSGLCGAACGLILWSAALFFNSGATLATLTEKRSLAIAAFLLASAIMGLLYRRIAIRRVPIVKTPWEEEFGEEYAAQYAAEFPTAPKPEAESEGKTLLRFLDLLMHRN